MILRPGVTLDDGWTLADSSTNAPSRGRADRLREQLQVYTKHWDRGLNADKAEAISLLDQAEVDLERLAPNVRYQRRFRQSETEEALDILSHVRSSLDRGGELIGQLEAERAAAGELYPWRATAEGRLAEVIVLDQFSRNVYRNTPQAFAQDPVALVLAQEAVASGALNQLDPTQRSFLLLPYMHSESRQIHLVAEALYTEYAPAVNLDFELRHKAIIDRFGRYPHRNEILGRTSTPEELEFLAQPGSRF